MEFAIFNRIPYKDKVIVFKSPLVLYCDMVDDELVVYNNDYGIEIRGMITPPSKFTNTVAEFIINNWDKPIIQENCTINTKEDLHETFNNILDKEEI